MGDVVSVYLENGESPFRGIIIEVNKEVSVDVWYKVKPIGEGVALGKTFWHRESHVKKERKNEGTKTEQG